MFDYVIKGLALITVIISVSFGVSSIVSFEQRFKLAKEEMAFLREGTALLKGKLESMEGMYTDLLDSTKAEYIDAIEESKLIILDLRATVDYQSKVIKILENSIDIYLEERRKANNEKD